MDSEGRASLAIALTLAVLAISAAGLAAADPPNDPDHGVNETTFPILWSADQDGNVSSGGEGDNATIAMRQLANGTDVSLNAPPADVQTWNDGEINEFPSTNRSVSIRPTGAHTEYQCFLKDAHATIFAVKPSARARLSSSETPIYVGEDGAVLGVVDYRIKLPEDETEGDRQVYCSTAGYDSHPEADMALCCLLAFWTGGDRSQMDRLFRQSCLMREKWDEVYYADGSTYGELTLKRATSIVTEYYDIDDAHPDSTDPIPAETPNLGSADGPRNPAYLLERNRLLEDRVDELRETLKEKNEHIQGLEEQLRQLQKKRT